MAMLPESRPPGSRITTVEGPPGKRGAAGDPTSLLGVLTPGEALTVDGQGNPASLGPVVSGSDLGLIQDPEGASVPGAFVRFVLSADLTELDDIQIVGAAQMGGVFDPDGDRVTSKAVRVKLDAAGEIDDLLVVSL
jgi:hypothetical protein